MNSLGRYISMFDNVEDYIFLFKDDENFQYIDNFYKTFLLNLKGWIENDLLKNMWDRNKIINVFQNTLRSSFEKMLWEGLVWSEKNLWNQILTNIWKKKNIDLFINWKKRIAIEAKTLLEINPLWAALLESILTSENYDAFYVISLSTNWSNRVKLTKNYHNIKKIVESPVLSKYFTDIVVFNPLIEGFEYWVINLFRDVRNSCV